MSICCCYCNIIIQLVRFIFSILCTFGIITKGIIIFFLYSYRRSHVIGVFCATYVTIVVACTVEGVISCCQNNLGVAVTTRALKCLNTVCTTGSRLGYGASIAVTL